MAHAQIVGAASEAPRQTAKSTSTGPIVGDLNTSIEANNLLVAAVASEKAQNQTFAGWERVVADLNANGNIHMSVYLRKADGTEDAGTLTFANNAPFNGAAFQCYQVSGWSEGDVLVDVVVATNNVPETATATASFAQATATWGADDNLVLGFIASGDDDETITAYPASYTDGVQTLSGAAANARAALASCRREVTTASETPGDATLSATENLVTATIMIKPASGASTVSITDAGDELYKVGDAVTITGADFEAVQGTGRVVISPADDINDVDAVAQTVTAWADTSVTIDAVRGSLAFGTQMYLFVENGSGNSNASGFLVQFEPLVQVSDTLEDESGSIVANRTGIQASIWRERAPTGAPDQELTGLSTNGAGLIEFEIDNTGLVPGDFVWLMLYEEDAVNWASGVVRVTPNYL
ncbi:MAG: hypothetical protein QNK05_20980 [Myxococcota bacterium]|nr:hypothetical protein [Myxococcota bacterium]